MDNTRASRSIHIKRCSSSSCGCAHRAHDGADERHDERHANANPRAPHRRHTDTDPDTRDAPDGPCDGHRGGSAGRGSGSVQCVDWIVLWECSARRGVWGGVGDGGEWVGQWEWGGGCTVWWGCWSERCV